MSGTSQTSSWLDVLATQQLNKLNKQHRQLISDIKECEQSYLDLGKAYYKFPSEPLRELMSPIDLEACEKAFVVLDQRDPDIVTSLEHMKTLKSEANESIRRQELERASGCLEIADDLSDKLKDLLVSLDFLTRSTDHRMQTRYNLERYADAGLPNPGVLPEKYAQLRNWILRLPESKKALELEISTEDEVIETALAETEDRITDAYEASEDEDEVLSPLLEEPERVGYPEAGASFHEATLEALEGRQPGMLRIGEGGVNEAERARVLNLGEGREMAHPERMTFEEATMAAARELDLEEFVRMPIYWRL